MKEFSNGQSGKCPFTSGQIKFSSGKGTKNNDWWPNQLNLNILRLVIMIYRQHWLKWVKLLKNLWKVNYENYRTIKTTRYLQRSGNSQIL